MSTNKTTYRVAALERLALVEDWDIERAHEEADEVLCDLLASLGYGDVVTAFRAVPKWYA